MYMYMSVRVRFYFVFPCNPLNDLKGGNYRPHFAVDDPKFREVK